MGTYFNIFIQCKLSTFHCLYSYVLRDYETIGFLLGEFPFCLDIYARVVAMKITKPQVISLMQVVTPYLHRTYSGFARRYLLRGSTYGILSDLLRLF